MDPGASESELIIILDKQYAETLKKIKTAYKLFEQVTTKRGHSIQENLREIELELQSKMYLSPLKDTKKAVASTTSVFNVKLNSKFDDKLRKNTTKLDTSALKNTTATISKLVRMGSKSYSGSPQKSKATLNDKKAAMIDESEIKLALAAYDKEDTKLLESISKALIKEYRKMELPQPNAEIERYYQAKIKPVKKKFKSINASTKDIKDFYTPQLGPISKHLGKMAKPGVPSTPKSTLQK